MCEAACRTGGAQCIGSSASRTSEQEGFANRKLIRPSRTRNDHNHSTTTLFSRWRTPVSVPSARNGQIVAGTVAALWVEKSAPPEQTNAENFYYQKTMQTNTPMVVVLHAYAIS